MYSTALHSFQDNAHLPDFVEVTPNRLKYFLESESQEKEAIAACIGEISESTYRLPSQQLAIQTLQNLEDSKILELLSISRLSGHTYDLHAEELSSKQIDALSHLKPCPDSHVLLWLRHARGQALRSQSRNQPISGLTTPQTVVTSQPNTALRQPLKTNARASPTTTGQSLAYDGRFPHASTKSYLGRHRLPNNSQRPILAREPCPSLVTDLHPWRCVNMFCDRHHDGHVYKTCDGWKRHMKEHEVVWRCMPHGPLEVAGSDLVCAICGSVNPNESHMAGHFIGDCGHASSEPCGVSRKPNLEKHLVRSHAVSDECARDLAGKWKPRIRKKHFACGFCVSIFSTFHEQLNHIDIGHFRKGQLITEWSATKVIRGLLLSPKVASWFQYIISQDPWITERDLHWDCQMIEDLQRRLEMADDAAKDLALEAYRMLTINLTRQNSYGHHISMSLSGQRSANQSEVTIDKLTVSAESLEKQNGLQIGELVQLSEYSYSLDECHVAGPPFSCSMPDCGLLGNRKDVWEVPTSLTYQSINPVVPNNFLSINAGSPSQSQSVYDASLTGSASNITKCSSILAYDSSDTTTHWQAAPSSIKSTSHTTEVTDTPGEQSKVYEGDSDIETDGMMTSNFKNYAESPNLQGNLLPQEIHDRSQVQKQSSREQLKSHHRDRLEPEHVREVMQHDRYDQQEFLTCDPRDLVMKRG